MKFIWKWILISVLVLVNLGVLAYLAVLAYARANSGYLGRGRSVSETMSPFISLIAVSELVGFLALGVTVLFWAAGVRWIPELCHGSNRRLIKVSLVFVPPGLAILFAVSRIFFR